MGLLRMPRVALGVRCGVVGHFWGLRLSDGVCRMSHDFGLVDLTFGAECDSWGAWTNRCSVWGVTSVTKVSIEILPVGLLLGFLGAIVIGVRHGAEQI